MTSIDAARLSSPSNACFPYGLSALSPTTDTAIANNGMVVGTPPPVSQPQSTKTSPPFNPCEHESHQCGAPVDVMYLYAVGGKGYSFRESE